MPTPNYYKIQKQAGFQPKTVDVRNDLLDKLDALAAADKRSTKQYLGKIIEDHVVSTPLPKNKK
jgi:hypothetical protein